MLLTQRKMKLSWPQTANATAPIRALWALIVVTCNLLVACAASAQSAPYTVSNTTSGAISDNTCMSRTLTVPTSSGLTTVGRVTIGVTLTHTYRSDLRMTLTAPNGTTSVVFVDRVGGLNDNFNATLSDSAAANVSTYGNETDTTSSPALKTFIPSNALSGFNGIAATGNWTLQICDVASQDIGNFLRADLTIAPPADLSITKSDGIISIISGRSTVYTLVVTNNGPHPVTGAILTDPVASGMIKSDVSCAASPGVCTSGTTPTIAQLEAGYALPTLASGQSYRLNVTVAVNAASGSVTNSATIAPPLAVSDPNTANNSASDTDSVTARTAMTAPTLTCPAGVPQMSWNMTTAGWNTTSNTGTYGVTNYGTFDFASVTNGTYLNISTSGNSTPNVSSPSNNGGFTTPLLNIAMNNTSVTHGTTITWKLSTPVPALQFSIVDVDFVANQFTDMVSVSGTFNGATVTPTLSSGVSNYLLNPNTVVGDALATDGSTDGNVVVTFSSPVDSITLVYGNYAPTTPSDPGNQAIGFFGGVKICQPDAKVTTTKTSTVVSDGVNTAANAKIIPGATVRYCITATNPGSGDADEGVSTDVLPTNVTYVAGSLKSGASCAAATTAEDDDATGTDETDPFGASYDSATRTVTGKFGQLIAGQSMALTFDVTIN